MPAKRAIAVVMSVLALLLAAAPVDAKPKRPKDPAADTVVFAGYQWDVKSSSGIVGPGPNVFSKSNVSVDESGALHLRINRKGRTWRSAEVVLGEALGYGTYQFTVDSGLTTLDPNVVLGLFTWSNDPSQAHREMDIEFSRWGDAGNPNNAGYTVQPYDVDGNQHLWNITTDAPTVHEFTWTPDAITFRSTRDGAELAAWTFSDSAAIPDPGDAAARINLWLFRGAAPTNGRSVEIVLSNFAFTPLG